MNANIIDIGEKFYHRLANRDSSQGDGKYNAIEFRERFLLGLDNEGAWSDDSLYIILDFKNVTKIGPSFANEAFSYFTKYAKPEKVWKKIRFENLTVVQKKIIDIEIKMGYRG